MNKKGLILSIFISLIVILSSGSVFAEDISNANSDDSASSPIANDAVYGEITTSSNYTVHTGSNSSTIQNIINSMHDGDVLNFEKGEYKDICIYIDKNITVNGNGAQLIGYQTPGINNTNIPDIVKNTTKTGGYGISNFATVYILKTLNVKLNGLTMVSLNSTTYSNAVLYAYQSKNLEIINNTIIGSSWGIYLQTCVNTTINQNTIKNQATTGILNFGSAKSIIKNNKITNAVNHGIDIRHGTGPNVTVFNNTVIGSKEGIYLMHSGGHTVYNNTLINCTISSITCYGSSNIYIYNNTLFKSRMGVLLGSGFSNITIGENNYNLDRLPFPPSFPYYIVQADNKYQTPDKAQGTYYDSAKEPKAVIIVDDITMYYKNGTKLHIALKDNKGYNLADTPITVTINGVSYKKTTDKNGAVEMNIYLKPGVYTATVDYAGNKTIGANSVDAKITVLPTITGNNITKMYQNETHFFAAFVNGQGKALANTKVTFNINGVFYTKQTNDKGIANLNIMLRPGHYILTAYNPVTGDEQGFSVDVKSLIEASDLTKYYLNASRFQATIYNKDGSLAVNKEVTYNINGVFYTKTTDENGVASLGISLRPGNYIITTIVDGLAMGNNVTVMPTLVTKDLDMKYLDGSDFTAQTLDGQGNPLANQNVSFNVNGVFYHKVTDKDGIASLKIRLMSGEYIITSYWNNFQTGNTIKIA